MSELKILVHLGKHINVVNLLGAVTINLKKRMATKLLLLNSAITSLQTVFNHFGHDL